MFESLNILRNICDIISRMIPHVMHDGDGFLVALSLMHSFQVSPYSTG